MTDCIPSSNPQSVLDKWLAAASADQLREYIREYQVAAAREADEPAAVRLETLLDEVEHACRAEERQGRRDKYTMQEVRETRAALLSAMHAEPPRVGMDTPWPLHDVLAKLIEATEHLLDVHDCDGHGHEEYRTAANAGKAMLPATKPASRGQAMAEWDKEGAPVATSVAQEK